MIRAFFVLLFLVFLYCGPKEFLQRDEEKSASPVDLVVSIPPELRDVVRITPIRSGAKKKICLNMIVKDESHVIERCLASVKPLIDYWVIVDTGSSDGTQEVIRKFMKGIPGELHERPWKNFGFNRTEALELGKGKGDYLLFMDADDYLEFEEGFELPDLRLDVYEIHVGNEGIGLLRPQLIATSLPWRWVGVLHEYVDCDRIVTREVLSKVKYQIVGGGGRSQDPQKYLKDAQLMEAALKEEPGNVRYVFYIADSYAAAGDYPKALEWHLKRVEMGGDGEDLFWSKFQIALLLQFMNLEPVILLESYRDAHAFRPARVEPVYHLAELYNRLERYEEAYALIKEWEKSPKPSLKQRFIFLPWMEEYGILFQKSIAAYYVGNYQESLEACDAVLKCSLLTEGWREHIESNRSFAISRLQEK